MSDFAEEVYVTLSLDLVLIPQAKCDVESRLINGAWCCEISLNASHSTIHVISKYI
jgi:hypothetical protein